MNTLANLRVLLTVFVVAFATVAGHTPVEAQTGIPFVPAGEQTATNGSLDALLEVLKDDAARAKLIAELESATGRADDAVAAETSIPDAELTLARGIADTSTAFVEETFQTGQMLWRDLTGIGSVFSSLPDEKIARVSNAWFPLVLTIISTVGILWLLTRATTVLLQKKRPGHTNNKSLGSTIFAVARNVVTDAAILSIAYAVGYVLAYFVFGQMGNILVEQSLYLNAFLIAGLIRITLRVFVLPDRPDEALSHLPQPIQRVIYRKVKLVSWLVVYGLSVGVPIVNVWTNLATGRSLRVIALTAAAVVALTAIRSISRMINREMEALRKAAEQKMQENAEEGVVADVLGEASVQAATSALNYLWPWFASIYVVAVWIIAITRPRLMADVIGSATIKTLIVCALIAIVFRLLRTAKTATAPVHKAVGRGFPELKGRLDGFAPLTVRFFALALSLIAAALLIDAWSAFDISEWLSGETGSALVWRVLSALVVVVLIVLIWAFIASWIDQRLTAELEGPKVSARSRTLLALFRNAFTVAIFIFGIMIALSQLGIDIAPLLAGAGVLGLAIGFGSQKLVQDIITGVFIQLENAINEGDVITVSATTGVVEKLTIRSVGVRDVNGAYHIVPFSSVDTVTNFMRGFGYHVEVVGIAYDADVSMAKEAMQAAFVRLRDTTEHGPFIINDLEMHGVVALADSSVNLRARIRAQPGKQWALGRAYTELVKEELDARGVDIPFPHRKLIISRVEADTLTSTEAGS